MANLTILLFSYAIGHATLAKSQAEVPLKVRLAAATQEISFDPTAALGYQQFVIMGLFHETLIGMRPDGQFESRIAVKWEFLKGDSVIFHIDPKAKFHDGRPITSNDVKHSICRHFNSKSAFRGSLERILKPKDPSDPCSAVTLLDNNRVQLNLKGPYPSLLELLSKSGLGIVPNDFNAHSPIGAGPFRLGDTWDINKAQLSSTSQTYERKSISEFTITTASDPSEGLKRVNRSEIDVLIGAPIESSDELEGTNFRLVPSNTLTMTNIYVNQNRDPFRTLDHRKKVYHWLKHQLLLDNDVLSELDSISDTILPSGILLPEYYQKGKALNGLATNTSAPKFLKGRKIRIIMPKGLFKRSFLKRLEKVCKTAKIDLMITEAKGKAFISPVISGEFELAVIPFLGLMSDPDGFVEIFSPSGILGSLNLDSMDLMHQLDSARFNSDPLERKSKYGEAFLKYQEKYIVWPLAQQNLPIILRKSLQADGFQYLFNIDLRSLRPSP